MRSLLLPISALLSGVALLLLGNGLLNTLLTLRGSAEGFSPAVLGLVMSGYFVGFFLGIWIAAPLIRRVGHIRAFAFCAALAASTALLHVVIVDQWVWLGLRVLYGIALVTLYTVIESWLNDQAEASQRGRVFGGYMIASYLGLVLGQMVLVVHPTLGIELLMLVAMCFSLCLVPVAATRKIHPAALHPAPLEPRFFIRRVPQSLTTVLVSGLLIGAFYGLAPLYATRLGLATQQVGVFMGSCILAALLVQWPLGWISDRRDRAWLIRACALLLSVAALPLALLGEVPLAVLLPLGFVVSLLQFSLYPLAVAFSNDHVEAERRGSLSAMLLVTFGIGACIGPLLAGVLMKYLGANMLYAFVSVCALILVWRVRPEAVTNLHQVDDAPLQHIPMPDSTASSPLTAALDPRVDEQVVEAQMQNGDGGSSAASTPNG